MISIELLNMIVEQVNSRLKNGEDVGELRQEILGRKGVLASALKDLPKLPDHEKRQIGAVVNQTKIQLLKMLETDDLKHQISIDLTLPMYTSPHGHEHPIQNMIAKLYQIFYDQGFVDFISAEIETEKSNFDSLRVPADHPARDMQDTFWTTNKMVMRTHTTAFQHNALEQLKPPFAVVQGGKIFRAEAEDATHLSEFHQFDFFAVAENLSFKDLKGLLLHTIKQIFSRDVIIRFRPSFFPFVEPGAELDIQCFQCHGAGCKACGMKGWIEILGCGMTHPEILSAHDLDIKQFSGIACGIGIERLAMAKFAVNDIREFTKNDPRFLEQIV